MTLSDTQIEGQKTPLAGLPCWVPESVKNYLAHTEAGTSIRSLARDEGCHPSTIMRQIRRLETRRDDPLIDAALRHLGAHGVQARDVAKGFDTPQDSAKMTKMISENDTPPDSKTLDLEAVRILRRLCEKGAVLAVAANMEKAVVVRDGVAGSSTRTGVVDRTVAEAMALKGWIIAGNQGKITRYQVTAAGRSALAGLMAKSESAQARKHATTGMAEAPAGFDHAKPALAGGEDDGVRKRIRYNAAESPLTALARRRDRDGEPFLTSDMVNAGEHLREDFELAQMGPRMAQDWDRFLTTSGRENYSGGHGAPTGPAEARTRVAAALQDLGPGLSDVVLRCCCYLEGLETVEKKLGWSARSGKIVLRIALLRLRRHYEETTGPGGPMIG